MKDRESQSPRTAVRGSLRTALLILAAATCTAADVSDEFRVKREGPFAFARKPVVTRAGDRVTIAFETKAFCDVTVAIEESDASSPSPPRGEGEGEGSGTADLRGRHPHPDPLPGRERGPFPRIVRHLASGVLGPNAPEPYENNSKRQTVLWDGKDDQGRYIDDKDAISVRVSLGLKPRFERTLLWHPKQRCGLRKMPRCVAQPEGVYVYEGAGVEYVRLFSHDGRYIRTVHPFPASKVRGVTGLPWHTFPDGHTAPRARGYWRSTYLLGGEGDTRSKWGSSANAFAVRGGRIATVSDRLCRLNTDGTCKPYPIYGPETKMPYPPQSIAPSPDGKWLYLTGCYMTINRRLVATHLARVKWQHGVYRMAYGADQPAELWLGSPLKTGKDADHFDHPSSVCVDAKGRVYIADNHNDRVQIFSADGALLKSLPVTGPAVLQIHEKTQALYVFCWTMALAYGYTAPPHKVAAALRVFDPFRSDEPSLAVPLPLEGYAGTTRGFMGAPHFDECSYRATLDSYTDPPTVWMGTAWTGKRSNARHWGLSRYRIEKRRLVRLEQWNHEVQRAITRWMPPKLQRQRMYVDPATGLLYVGEQGKAFDVLTRIDPGTGRMARVTLPYTAEEAAIDLDGQIYLRCATAIGRFRLDTMQEVPFDYGRACSVRWSSSSRGARLVGALVVPGNKPVWWHESGMGVNPNGELVVSCCNSAWRPPDRRSALETQAVRMEAGKYAPRVYPGRFRYAEIHIFDKRGKVAAEDVVKGVMDGHGTFIDPRGDVYFLAGGHRVYDGDRDFFPLTGCVIKFARGKGRLYARRNTKRVPVPMPPDLDTAGLPQIACGTLGRFWIEGAEWVYPGVGYVHPSAPCQCWNCRFAIDYFGRVFVPETVRNQVAVLDTNGSLLMHIGRYGNVDDGVPLAPDQRFRTAPPTALGGDEVALCYANYLATHTDRRLFIADGGNARILSVRLGYETTERVALKDVADEGD